MSPPHAQKACLDPYGKKLYGKALIMCILLMLKPDCFLTMEQTYIHGGIFSRSTLVMVKGAFQTNTSILLHIAATAFTIAGQRWVIIHVQYLTAVDATQHYPSLASKVNNQQLPAQQLLFCYNSNS